MTPNNQDKKDLSYGQLLFELLATANQIYAAGLAAGLELSHTQQPFCADAGKPKAQNVTEAPLSLSSQGAS